MGKNLLNAYENGLLDDMMEEETQTAMAAKRAPKPKAGQKDQKRLRDTYISSNKKGAASRAARMAKYAEQNEKPQGRRERSVMDDLQDDICGRRGRR